MLAGPGASEHLLGVELGHTALPGLARSWVWAQPALGSGCEAAVKPPHRATHPGSVSEGGCWRTAGPGK